MRITGAYRDGVVHVESATAHQPPAHDDFVWPRLPCQPPRGGWRPGYGFDTNNQPDAIDVLDRWVRSRSATYTGIWEGQVDEVGKTKNVWVLGTTGDVAAARAEVAAQYPGNVCIYKVKFSARDLQAIVDRLRAALPAKVDATADPVSNRVVVTAIALDPTTTSVLGQFTPDALTIRQPLLLPVIN